MLQLELLELQVLGLEYYIFAPNQSFENYRDYIQDKLYHLKSLINLFESHDLYIDVEEPTLYMEQEYKDYLVNNSTQYDRYFESVLFELRSLIE